MPEEIAKRDFVVEASRDRVWRLIGKVIFSCLPGMEEVEILDENRFRAVLRMKILGVNLSMKLKGEMVDLLPPESFAVKLDVDGPGGLFPMSQKVSIVMSALGAKETALSCKATTEEMGLLFRVFLLGQARRSAGSTFEAIGRRLQELA